MTSFKLILASLRFYWRTQLGVLLGVVVATAVLVGAMVVGDSVRQSLRDLALARLGETHLALAPHERFFRVGLKDRIENALDVPAASVLMVPGTAQNQKTGDRANQIQVLGVDRDFWAMMWPLDLPENERPVPPSAQRIILTQKLATMLGVKQGDEVLVRVSKPSLLPRDAPLTRTDVSDISLALRVTVEWVLADDRPNPGRFSMQASQMSPLNAFVNLTWLQDELKLQGQANLMLVGANRGQAMDVARANEVMAKEWQLADVNVELRHVSEQGMYELRSSRIFLDPPLVDAAIEAGKSEKVGVLGVLTYLINEFDAGARKAPYSMATGLDVLHQPERADAPQAPSGSVAWPDLLAAKAVSTPTAENAATPTGAARPIILNDWLASDLRVNVGDTIRLKYFIIGPMRDLVETTSEPFTVSRIVPLEGAAADRTFLPEFPDLPDENTTFSQWKPGFQMTRQIRSIDDDYWARYRGTPKAFVALDQGQAMWGNRFGSLTSIRFPAAGVDQAKLAAAIRDRLDPASLGLSFIPVRADALNASSQGFDFAQLFLGFSFFLIVAALLLTGLLFVFAIEQRSAEVGTLLAVGLSARRVRRILLGEGLLLAMIGGAIGVALGLLYTRLLLLGLTTIWRDAISTSSLVFHAKPATLIIGWSASVAVALLTIWLVLRKQARTPARELLAGGGGAGGANQGNDAASGKGKVAFAVGCVMLLGAVALLASVGIGRGTANAGAFFGGGSMLLIAGLAFSFALLTRLVGGRVSHGKSQIHHVQFRMSLGSLSIRNGARRRGRSLATIGLLACGSFLVIAIGAFWLDSSENAQDRKSGTGGFALYGESTLPVLVDLNSDEGLDKFALEREDLPGVSFVSMRVRDGDDASCLNLNRAQNPRLAGVNRSRMMDINPFTFASGIDTDLASKGASSWSLLHGAGGVNADTIPAIGDANTITYGLGLGVGDTLDYTDEAGRLFKVKIVATLSNSILQGSLFIDEEQFKKRFPSVSGHRSFLIDAPWDKLDETRKTLNEALADVGIELTPTVERLAAFNAVQNTYLGIFQALGGLGLLLGSIGLGIVVLRNVLERRRELALLAAVGFTQGKLRSLVQREHWLLLALGLLVGVISAAIAVLPAVLSPGAKVPYLLLALILTGVVVSGLLWTWLASRIALRGSMLAALRDE